MHQSADRVVGAEVSVGFLVDAVGLLVVAGVEAIAVGSYSRVVNTVRQIEQGAVPRRRAVLARACSVPADLELTDCASRA